MATVFAVLGVAPAGFDGNVRGLGIDAWIPVSASPLLGIETEEVTNRGNRGYSITGRLAPGVTLEGAQASMNVVAQRLASTYPQNWPDLAGSGRRLTLVPESDTRVPPKFRGPTLGFFALLMGMAGLVLLICCANVASLTLARATGRLPEIGVRLSLGASRRRVIRQLLTESSMVALLGGAIGVLIAIWATRAMMAFQPPVPVRLAIDLSLDTPVLLFSFAAAMGTGILFGIAPALRASRPDVLGLLKGNSARLQLGGRRRSLQSMLVVSQVTMSLSLLVAALLFLRSLQSVAAIDPGFRMDRLLIAELVPPPGTERTANYAQVMVQVQEKLEKAPGVVGVTAAGSVLLGLEGRMRRGTTVEGDRRRDGEDMEFHMNRVGPGYLKTMGIALVEGREFSTTDNATSPGVVMVSEAFARRFWPDQRALGKRVSFQGDDGPFLEIIGVARDGRYVSLSDQPVPYMFVPLLQEPRRFAVHLRASGSPRDLTGVLLSAVSEVGPGWSVTNTRTMDEEAGTSLLPQRVAASVLSLFGMAALALAAIGLYGTVAYSVAARTREIGVRVALGARRGDVVRLMLREDVVLTAVGLAIGIPAAWGVSRLLAGFLLGATSGNAVAFVGAGLLLAGTSLLASWIPARRAASLDAMRALRSD
ncbi:MAG: ADOP family duplicated permease [Gemmatimonadaceae bacterium]